MSAPAKRPGRRPGSADTRGEILDAARAEFASRGYEKATVRGIARAAGVDSALVHHYFGSKDRVFLAALEFPVDPAVVLEQVAGDPAGIGERLARFVVGLWERAAGAGAVAGGGADGRLERGDGGACCAVSPGLG